VSVTGKLAIWLVVALAAAGLLAGWRFWPREGGAPAVETAAAESAAGGGRELTVVVSPAASRDFETALRVQGNVESKDNASVPARVFGTLDAVLVDEGDAVRAGETVLFEVDRENLSRAVVLSERDVAVAACAVRESEASLAMAEANLEKSTVDVERFRRLREKDAATADALEQQETRHRQAVAQADYASAVVDLAREKAGQAEVALEIAEKNLRDSRVTAPLSGVVTQRMQEPGEMAEPGKPVVRIENLAVLEVVAFLPAEAYGRVTVGETGVRVTVSGIDAGTHPVAYKSPTISPQLRTFEIKCVLAPPPEGVAPGALADLSVVLAGREGLGVPRDAVQVRGGQEVVFTVSGDRASMVPVTTGLVSNGWVEVTAGIEAGAAVVTAGQYMLEDGAAVSVKEGTS